LFSKQSKPPTLVALENEKNAYRTLVGHCFCSYLWEKYVAVCQKEMNESEGCIKFFDWGC